MPQLPCPHQAGSLVLFLWIKIDMTTHAAVAGTVYLGGYQFGATEFFGASKNIKSVKILRPKISNSKTLDSKVFGSKDRGETWTAGTIVQREAPEDLITPVPLYAEEAGKPPVFLGRIFADGRETTFRLRVPSGTRKILLDPQQTLLRQP